LYQRLPPGRRAGLHRSIGAIVEASYGQHASELAAELAMHFDRGHDHTRAIVHLQAAAEVARRRGAIREAQVHLERAIAILDRQPAGVARDEQEIALRIKFGSLLQVSRGFGAAEVERAFARARALCEQIGDQPRLFPALWGLWLFYWGRGRLAAAIDLAEHLQALALQTNDRSLRLQAHHACWVTAFSRGHLLEAHDYATQGLALYDTAQDAPTAAYYGNHDPAVCAAAFSARATALMGQVQAALRVTEWAVSHARELKHPVTVCHSLTFAAWVHHLRQNAAASSECAEAALALAREHDLNLFGAWAAVSAGWADVQQGQHEIGLRRIREAIANVRAIGSEQFLSHMLGVFAEACLAAGAHDEGRSVLQEALSYVDSSGERFYEAELHRTSGELLLAGPPRDSVRDAAESAFQLARTVAHDQGAALLELRATISLARVWLETGREADAREMMLSAHGLAPEAHTLPDVRAAFTLIECSR
jgi:predicted ATPase